MRFRDSKMLVWQQRGPGPIAFGGGMTLLEMILALAMVVIISAVILPQFRAIDNGWDSREAAAEVIQNGRVLTEHINRILSQAVKITAVSEPNVANGFIEFEDNAGLLWRYDMGEDNYIEFGEIGAGESLAGPVSSLSFTCYDRTDFSSPVYDLNDVDAVRFVKAEVTFPNSTSLGRDKSFTAWAYVRTNVSPLIGWWKLDETSGTTAVDSSVKKNHGTLTNMAGNEWTTGVVGGGLEFDGSDDRIAGIGNCPTGNYTIAGWAKDTGPITGKNNWSVFYCAEQELWFGVDRGASPQIHLDSGGNNHGVKTAEGAWTRNVWYHIAATWDGTTVHLYIDGIDMPVTIYGTPHNPNATVAAIGSWSGIWNEEVWYGTIDDVRIYDQALTAEEIALLANIIWYREFTEAKAASDTTSITISTPADTNEADLLVAAVATDGDTSALMAPPPGENWTEIDVGAYGSDVTLGAWWKLADASESASHQFTWSGGQQVYAWMMRFTGLDPNNPVNVLSTGVDSGSNPTSPAVTTTVDNCLILRLGAFDDGDIAVDAPGLNNHTAITMDVSDISSVTYEEFTEAKVDWTTSVTISTPAGTSEGNLLIAAVATDSNETLSPPGGEGWMLIDQGVGSDAVTLGVWWKLADASESGSHQFTWGLNEEAYGWIMRFTGHDPTSPINTSQAQGGDIDSMPPSPSVSTTVANTMILRIGGFDDDDVNVDNPGLAGHATITMDKSNTSNFSCSGGAGWVQQGAIGDSGSVNFSLTKDEQYRTVTVAIASDPVVVDGSVSGGAGYVWQSASGNSGTSTFSLTASEESRTVTIGIAQGTQNSLDTIYP